MCDTTTITNETATSEAVSSEAVLMDYLLEFGRATLGTAGITALTAVTAQRVRMLGTDFFVMTGSATGVPPR